MWKTHFSRFLNCTNGTKSCKASQKIMFGQLWIYPLCPHYNPILFRSSFRRVWQKIWKAWMWKLLNINEISHQIFIKMRAKEVELLLKMLYSPQLCSFVPKDCKENNFQNIENINLQKADFTHYSNSIVKQFACCIEVVPDYSI